MNGKHALVRTLLRNDLMAFTQRCLQTVVPGQKYLQNWHIEAIAHELERCRRRENRRLIITIPPRNSLCAGTRPHAPHRLRELRPGPRDETRSRLPDRPRE